MNQLVYQGHIITDKGEMLSLTDMWKAAGSDDARRPSDWLALSSTKEFREAVEATLVAGNTGIQVKRGGRGVGGETFGHWQIGLAYAKYLSADFHMWCNTQVRAVMEGKMPSALPDDIVEMLRRGDGMTKQIIRKVTLMQKEQADLSARLVDLEDRLQSPNTCTAHDLWVEHNLHPLKGGTVWLGNRLIEMGCSPEFGSRSKTGSTWRRRFDAGRARIAMKNGLLLLAHRYVDERQGQGKLHLVQRE